MCWDLLGTISMCVVWPIPWVVTCRNDSIPVPPFLQIFSSVTLFLEDFLKPSQQKRRVYINPSALFFFGSLGLEGRSFLKAMPNQHDVNDVNEAATSFGWAHPFWSIGILGGVLIRIGELDWAVSYRECCGYFKMSQGGVASFTCFFLRRNQM